MPFGLIAQEKVIKSSNYFDDLTLEEREIIVKKGTERAWSGIYLSNTDNGIYVCKACNNPLFNSDSKFKSNCGWPSFDDEIKGAIKKITDADGRRTEILCNECGGHLGHVFNDGPKDTTGKRHCINGVALKFVAEE